MQKPDSLKLYLNFRKYEAPPKFKGLIDVDDEIYSQLIYNPNHEYHVKSKVSEETFSLFLEYWISGKEPLITQNNLFEYAQLSEEFKILKEVIQKAKNSFDVCEQNLYKLKHLKNIDKKSIEQTISSNLDLYIEKQGENLISLDIQTLYNIFSQSNGNFSKHNEAYNLIKKHYEKYKDDAIFILLPILESEKLTYSNFKEIIDESETRFGFLPKKVIIFFEEQNKKIEELSKLFQQSQTELKQTKEELKQTKEELEQTKEELEHTKKENGGYKNVISLQKGELDSLKLENVEKNKKIGQIESHLIERDNEINQKLEEMKVKTREYNSLQTQFDKKVEEVKKQNNFLTKKDEEIAKLGTEIKERNQEKALLQTTINNKISEISRLEKIISDKEREIRGLQTKVESAQNECKRLNKYIDDETVRIYDKGDYSKITYISYSSDQKGDENKKNYAMEITRKSFNMHDSNYDRAKYVVNQLENRYDGKWYVIIHLQFHGDYYFTYYDNCYFGFKIGEYAVTVFKARPNC